MSDDSLWFRPPPRPSRTPVAPTSSEPATVELVIDGQADSVAHRFLAVIGPESLRM